MRKKRKGHLKIQLRTVMYLAMKQFAKTILCHWPLSAPPEHKKPEVFCFQEDQGHEIA